LPLYKHRPVKLAWNLNITGNDEQMNLMNLINKNLVYESWTQVDLIDEKTRG
jgi:hypothetical protein